MLRQERHLRLSFRKKRCFYSSPTTIQRFPLKIRGLEFCSFVQTAQEITHNLQNKRKLFLICPTLIPLGQDFFKQFPTPRPKGLNLSWELPVGGGGNRSSWTFSPPPPPISVEKSFNCGQQSVGWQSAGRSFGKLPFSSSGAWIMGEKI